MIATIYENNKSEISVFWITIIYGLEALNRSFILICSKCSREYNVEPPSHIVVFFFINTINTICSCIRK